METLNIMRTRRFASTAATLAATALLLTACNSAGGADGDSGSTEGTESVYPGVTQQQVYDAMSVWGTGCEIFNDLQPLLDFWGVEDGEPISPDEEDPSLYPSCEGHFDITSSGVRVGDSRAEIVLQTYETDEEAAADYTTSVEEGFTDPEDSEDEITEGELAGDWSESYYWANHRQFGTDVIGYARHGNWIIFFATYAGTDPGADETPSFTQDEFVAFVTEEYLPGIKTKFDAKFEE